MHSSWNAPAIQIVYHGPHQSVCGNQHSTNLLESQKLIHLHRHKDMDKVFSRVRRTCCWRSGNHNAQSFHCSFIISRTENSNYSICLHILQPDTLLDMFCSHILDHITGQCPTTHPASRQAYLSIPWTGQANLSGNSGETLNVKLCMLHVNIELLSYLWLFGELVNVHRTSQPFASRSRKHKLGTLNTPPKSGTMTMIRDRCNPQLPPSSVLKLRAFTILKLKDFSYNTEYYLIATLQ
jgi:hypothetical protein